MVKRKVVWLRTKTEYVNKPTELRDYKEYWIKRLIRNSPTHFYKHNQHGIKSPLFRIVRICIVGSPKKYLEEGMLHSELAIKLVGIEDAKDFVVGDVKEK